MARTINEIFTDKLNRVAADPTLSPLLTSTSKVAVYRLLLYIAAVSCWILENLHDLFKKEVEDTIAAMKPHSPQWYAEKAKAFQYGFNLVPETDKYNNTGIADSVIEDSKVVDHAAVIEQQSSSIRLRIKVATDKGNDLEPLLPGELNSLIAYMQRIKDAGVKLLITSTIADALKLGLRIKYNALVLNAAGARIDGTNATPLQSAIRTFLKNLPFNGVFSIQKLVDAIQAVEGVDDVSVDAVQTKYGAPAFTTVDITYTPDSGYLRIDDADLNIQFIAA